MHASMARLDQGHIQTLWVYVLSSISITWGYERVGCYEGDLGYTDAWQGLHHVTSVNATTYKANDVQLDSCVRDCYSRSKPYAGIEFRAKLVAGTHYKTLHCLCGDSEPGLVTYTDCPVYEGRGAWHVHNVDNVTETSRMTVYQLDRVAGCYAGDLGFTSRYRKPLYNYDEREIYTDSMNITECFKACRYKPFMAVTYKKDCFNRSLGCHTPEASLHCACGDKVPVVTETTGCPRYAQPHDAWYVENVRTAETRSALYLSRIGDNCYAGELGFSLEESYPLRTPPAQPQYQLSNLDYNKCYARCYQTSHAYVGITYRRSRTGSAGLECRCGSYPLHMTRSINCAKYARWNDTWYWEIYTGAENSDTIRTIMFTVNLTRPAVEDTTLKPETPSPVPATSRVTTSPRDVTTQGRDAGYTSGSGELFEDGNTAALIAAGASIGAVAVVFLIIAVVVIIWYRRKSKPGGEEVGDYVYYNNTEDE